MVKMEMLGFILYTFGCNDSYISEKPPKQLCHSTVQTEQDSSNTVEADLTSSSSPNIVHKMYKQPQGKHMESRVHFILWKVEKNHWKGCKILDYKESYSLSSVYPRDQGLSLTSQNLLLTPFMKKVKWVFQVSTLSHWMILPILPTVGPGR